MKDQAVDPEIFADNAPEMLNELAAIVAKIAQTQFDMDDELARQMGIEVAVEISERWRGVAVYIPSALRITIASRDMEMFKKFNGHNHVELAREFKCSVVWVYKVIKRVRQQMQDKQQSQLPFK